MLHAREHCALVSEVTELRREVEGQALYARVEAREELMCDEKNADLRRPSKYLHPSPASGTAPYIVGGGSTSPNGARPGPHVSAGGRS